MLDCLDDVVDDISVFHRVDEPLDLPSPTFFRMAQRLRYRSGAVAAVRRAAGLDDEEGVIFSAGPPSAVEAVSGAAEGTADDITAMAAMSQNPGFPGIGYSRG